MNKKHIVYMDFDFEEEEDSEDFFAIPKEWGKEFKNKKTINNKNWVFEISESYEMFEGDLDIGLPGRYGKLELDLLETPCKTLAQKLYNDSPNLLRHTENVDGDKCGSVIPIVEMIHLVYDRLASFVRSDKAIEIYEARLNEMYKDRIKDINKYGK
jgi:hypothetical protein